MGVVFPDVELHLSSPRFSSLDLQGVGPVPCVAHVSRIFQQDMKSHEHTKVSI